MMKKNYKDLPVVKSNEIIGAKYRLTARAQKFILFMAAMLNPKDEVFKYQTVQIKDIEELLNGDGKKWGGIYNEIKSIILSLNNKPLKITNKDGSVLIANWIASAEIRKGSVEFEFSEKLKPYFLQLNSHFTKFKLKNILKLKSSYAIRFYEIMKSYQFIGHVEFSVKELKSILCIEDKYKTYYDFKKRVLRPAREELIAFSDVYFDFDEMKEGRAIKWLRFNIKENKEVTETIKVSKEEQKELNNDLVAALQKIGFSEFKAVELYQIGFEAIVDAKTREEVEQEYDSVDDFFTDKYNLVTFEAKKKQIKNKAGYFLKAIQENYKSTAYQISKVVKINRQKQKKNDATKQEYVELYEQQQKLFSQEQQNIISQLITSGDISIEGIMAANNIEGGAAKYKSHSFIRTKVNFFIRRDYASYFKHLEPLEENMKQLKKMLDNM